MRMKDEEKRIDAYLRTLNTPYKVQAYLDSIPFNNETEGESCMSAYRVYETGRAHCLEAAFFAGACFRLSGRVPLAVSLKVKKPDDDHMLILFKENGYWGAISKTSHPVLRYRDPIYRSVRELVMSYYHEYFLFRDGTKTLIGYTKPLSLNRYGTSWIHGEEDQWDIAAKIFYTPIMSIVPPENKRFIRKVPPFERKALDVLEWG